MHKNFYRLKLSRVCFAMFGLAVLHSGLIYAEERPLDAPRAQGLVGERFDGYVVVHDSKASPEITLLIEQINAERRKVYDEKAAAQSVPAVEVGKVYATQIMDKAPAGTWFQGPDGNWAKK